MILTSKQFDEHEHNIRLTCHRLRKLTNAAWLCNVDVINVGKKDLDVLLKTVVRLQKDKKYLTDLLTKQQKGDQ